MVYKFFDKKTGWRISASEQSAEKLHKTVIENFYRRNSMRGLKTMFWQHF